MSVVNEPQSRADPVSPELSAWIVAQRWYAGKGHEPQWERIGGFELMNARDITADGADRVGGPARIQVHLFLDHSGIPLLYQVPITVRAERVPNLDAAFIAEIPGAGFLYDGCRDPAGAAAILRLVLDEGTARPDDSAAADPTPGIAARGHLLPATPPMSIVSSRVLSGEQSNTSIIYETTDASGAPAASVICKVFRTLHHGDNPDVTLQGALTAAGSTSVPTSVGFIAGQWRDSGERTGFAHGHLAFAQEFLPGVEDAWRSALRAAESCEDFTERARSLGAASADIHTTLASALPTSAATPAQIAATIDSMRARFNQAAAEVPAIELHRAAIELLYARLGSLSWPPMQRIHGDYHLGQVLSVPDRGWVALDFEGEPLRPMRERAVNDSPLRDIAGMLRSFDYVAGSVAQQGSPAQQGSVAQSGTVSQPGMLTQSGTLAQSGTGVDVSEWAGAARRAFLEGYAENSPLDLEVSAPLIDAFELDKALYEAVYEARNRPGWLAIPVSAVERLIAG